MWKSLRVAVIVPAFKEERLIIRTLMSIPEWVDAIYVVDDASPDATGARVRELGSPRVRLLQHAVNRGVGRAIVTGYRAALDEAADVLVVMAADNQMDPADLPTLLMALERGAEYVKGNRFVHPERLNMPWQRRVAGKGLAALTRLSTGLVIDDSQCGYTALSARVAERLPLEELWPSYGYPNDLLVMLAAEGARVAEVPVRPVYADEESGIRFWHAAVVAGVTLWRSTRARTGLLGRFIPSTRRPFSHHRQSESSVPAPVVPR